MVNDSRVPGALLLCCAAVSLVISNSAAGNAYISFWQQKTPIISHDFHLPGTVEHGINDLLMSVFFFAAGLEIKREMLSGHLSDFKGALMPFVSATGGMLLPAIIYIAVCPTVPDIAGWGIPMATDIAFSLGILSLLGGRVPQSLRIFITAIAIIDDIGGILAIALFYAGHLQWGYMLAAGAVALLLIVVKAYRKLPLWIYMSTGIVLWYLVYNSGIHATIAGVILAFIIPRAYIDRLVHGLATAVNFVILPLFALANTAIALPANIVAALNVPVFYGIVTGLMVGKPLGIVLFTWAAQRLKLAALPGDMSMKHVFGAGMVAGIGFTVSMFIATLAFTDIHMQQVAKLAVLIASVGSGVAGYLYLRYAVAAK
ncbi:MAG: Na+/H+ antiporter NhaA [Bacteroidota bacterium]